MADFHRFGRAAAIALGWTPQLFDTAMREAEARQNRGAADNTLVAAMVAFAQQQHRWVGDMPSLLERLVETAKLRQLSRSRNFWPETAIGLGRKVELLRSALAEHGVSITPSVAPVSSLVQLEYNAEADGQGVD